MGFFDQVFGGKRDTSSGGSSAKGFACSGDVIYVGGQSKTSCKTITEAIKKAAAGSVILVSPGIYSESVSLDKPVQIEGQGKPGAVIINGSDDTCVTVWRVAFCLKKLTLRAKSRGIEVASDTIQGATTPSIISTCVVECLDRDSSLTVGISRPRAQIDHCEIRYFAKGIDDPNGDIRSSHIHSCVIGISVEKKPRMEDVRIEQNKKAIKLSGQYCAPSFVRCQIAHNKTGVFAISGASATFESCKFLDNGDNVDRVRDEKITLINCNISEP